jgi:hypothetical protein
MFGDERIFVCGLFESRRTDRKSAGGTPAVQKQRHVMQQSAERLKPCLTETFTPTSAAKAAIERAGFLSRLKPRPTRLSRSDRKRAGGTPAVPRRYARLIRRRLVVSVFARLRLTIRGERPGKEPAGRRRYIIPRLIRRRLVDGVFARPALNDSRRTARKRAGGTPALRKAEEFLRRLSDGG